MLFVDHANPFNPMLARLIAKLMLALLGLVALGAWLFGAPLAQWAQAVAGLPPGSARWAVVLVLPLAVAVALLVEAATITLLNSRACASPNPLPAIGAMAGLALWWRESGAFVKAACWYLPFAHWLRPRDRLAGASMAKPIPVLLLHGYVCNGGFWKPMADVLHSLGYHVHTHSMEPVFGGISSYTQALFERIEAICRLHDVAQLQVVAHSMGGLAMRDLIAIHGGARIAKLVTLGTPHRGTRLANIGPGTNARNMQPGSPWLADLAARETPQPGVPMTCVVSYHDNIVFPQASAIQPGAAWAHAKLIERAGIGHVEMNAHPEIRRIVLQELL
jgi:Palmitoyl protein thioesterase